MTAERPQLPRPDTTGQFREPTKGQDHLSSLQKTQNLRSGPPHLPTNEEIPPILTVTKENGEQKRVTQEQLEDFETEFFLATHLPHAKSLGS